MLAGFILDGMGWQWVLFWPAIGCGLGLVILFFTMEETKYNRKTVGIVETIDTLETFSLATGQDAEKGLQTSAAPVTGMPTSVYQKRRIGISWRCS